MGLYPWWGKLRLVRSRSRPGFVVVPKALVMARLSAEASLLALLPPSFSRFCPLAPYCHTPLTGWHPTAHHRLAPYCYSLAGILLLIVVGWHLLGPVAPLALLPLRLSDPSSVTPSHGIALPPWLLSNALDRRNDLPDRASGYCGPMVPVFAPVGDYLPTPPGPRFGSLNKRFLLFWRACGRVWVFLPVRFYILFPYVSGVYYPRC